MYTQQPKKNGRFSGHVGSEPTESTLAEAPELGHAISLTDVLRTIRKWFWVILLVAALLVAAVLGYSRTQTPIYEASTTILVGQNSGLIQNPGDVGGLEELTETMAQAVPSRRVAEAVIQQLNPQTSPQDLIGNLRAEKVGQTQFVRVTYRDTSPQKAQQVVNTVGEEFSAQVAELQGVSAATIADAYRQAAADAVRQAEGNAAAAAVPLVPPTPTITATVWEQAQVPETPVSPNPKRDGLFALALGLMLGFGVAFLLEHHVRGNNWQSLDELEQVSGVPTIGVIPK